MSTNPRTIERLLAESSDAEFDAELSRCGFVAPSAARERLRGLHRSDTERTALQRSLPTLLLALADAATPDGSLVNFERFVLCVEDRGALFEYLAENPRAIEILVRLFVGSQFLTEILLRNPGHLERLVRHKRLAEHKSRADFLAEAHTAAEAETNVPARLDALRRFQQWELLRIGACDSFGLMDLKSVTVQLSLLADALVQACLDLLSADLELDVDEFVVLAFGKLGGEELNYSSDIDLVFLAEGDATRFWALGQKLIGALEDATAEGFLYRVDMRLRPWGSSGALVNAVDAHVEYVREHGRPWERQALLKARSIAGNHEVGRRFLERIDPEIFAMSVDEARTNARTMKARIEERLAGEGRAWGEVKSGVGSIRDVEFVTQFLQLAHGRENRNVKSIGTLDGLIRLAEFGHLHADEYRRLAGGYVFLRTIEHALQLTHYERTHAMPDDPRELAYLARRLDYPDAEHFLAHYRRHTSAIRAIYEKYVVQGGVASGPELPDAAKSIPDHVARMQPSYVKLFDAERIDRHARMLERLDDHCVVVVEAEPRHDVPNTEDEGSRINPGTVATRDGSAPLGPEPTTPNRTWRVTVVGYDHTGDLAVAAGLLYVYGFNIVGGHAFSDEQVPSKRIPRHRRGATGSERIFIDVFDVEPPLAEVLPAVWERFEEDLNELASLHRAGRSEEAQGALAKKVAAALRDDPTAGNAVRTDYPVEIEVDNESATRTMLHIRGEDTKGFLYELANALALSRIDVSRLVIRSEGSIVFDTLYVTDENGEKITDPESLRELRAAIVLIKHFSHLLPHSPNPESALLQFRDFLRNLFQRPNWIEDFASLERSEVLGGLARLLGVSTFLWEDFLRLQHDNLFPVVSDPEGLTERRMPAEWAAQLDDELAAADSHGERVDALNAFKDREMFRVDMRHILGHVDEFGAFARELTHLAEVVVTAALRLCTESLVARHGVPRLDDGRDCPVCVAALGKFGGKELGYGSDIELMFVFEGGGRTDGGESISNDEFFRHLVEAFTKSIRARQEGIFQIDLRLRPYGRAGSLAVSLDAFRTYFEPEGPAWPYERQALVKLRPVAGDAAFGKRVVAVRDDVVYTGAPFDVQAMRALRERQLNQLVTAGTFNAKLGTGGLVDIEYLVQALQITHGHDSPRLRATNTRKASKRLEQAGLLSVDQRETLKDAYIFLRRLIDALRMVRGNARDLTVPEPDTEEFEFLARRLGYGNDLARLRAEGDRHIANVVELGRLLDAMGNA